MLRKIMSISYITRDRLASILLNQQAPSLLSAASSSSADTTSPPPKFAIIDVRDHGPYILLCSSCYCSSIAFAPPFAQP